MRNNTLKSTLTLAATLVSVSEAHAATCSYDEATRRVDVQVQGDLATLARGLDGSVSVNGVACGSANMATLASIVARGTTAADRLTIDLQRGGFGNVPMSINLDHGRDIVTLSGTALDDHYVAGSLGINANASVDDYAEIALGSVEVISMTGFSGNDLLSGEGGFGTGSATNIMMTLTGGVGDDTLIGGNAGDQLAGGEDDDVLLGGEGHDGLIGGNGNDYEDGQGGDDLFKAGVIYDGDDHLIGGEGRDLADFSQRLYSVVVTLDDVADDGDIYGERDNVGSDVENVSGGLGDDYIVGSALANVLRGNAAGDWIDGGAGDDQIYGGDGDDMLFGSEGVDSLWGDNNDDILFAGEGDDYLFGGDGIDQLQGDGGRDTFSCGGGYGLAVDLDPETGADCNT